ncbi:tetratricopeptide repeat protein [Embleya hyalina]|uniref:Uncharacterized protein n=1 Tax=Embleya hyalina TaxID=516124 RepID=A0A401Z668_9ACTN|nr:tetratricopeptide repeat protein [Embleya hyalina]GCE02333.1 hypothetical protein EHYA_10110 [Embleya hyalina]
MLQRLQRHIDARLFENLLRRSRERMAAGRPDDAKVLLDRALAHGIRAFGTHDTRVLTHITLLALAHASTGRTDAARRLLAEARDLVHDRTDVDPVALGGLLVIGAALAGLAGAVEDARTWADEFLTLTEETPIKEQVVAQRVAAHLQLTDIEFEQGRLRDALRHLHAAGAESGPSPIDAFVAVESSGGSEPGAERTEPAAEVAPDADAEGDVDPVLFIDILYKAARVHAALGGASMAQDMIEDAVRRVRRLEAAPAARGDGSRLGSATSDPLWAVPTARLTSHGFAAVLLTAAGIAQARGRSEAALRHLDEGESRLRAHPGPGDRVLRAHARHLRALIAADRHDYEGARKLLDGPAESTAADAEPEPADQRIRVDAQYALARLEYRTGRRGQALSRTERLSSWTNPIRACGGPCSLRCPAPTRTRRATAVCCGCRCRVLCCAAGSPWPARTTATPRLPGRISVRAS